MAKEVAKFTEGSKVLFQNKLQSVLIHVWESKQVNFITTYMPQSLVLEVTDLSHWYTVQGSSSKVFEEMSFLNVASSQRLFPGCDSRPSRISCSASF